MRKLPGLLVLLLLFGAFSFADAGDEEFQQVPPPKVQPVAPESSPVTSTNDVEVKAKPDPYMEEVRRILTKEEAEKTTLGSNDTASEDTSPADDDPAGIPVVGAVLQGFMALCATLALVILLLLALKKWGRRTPLLSGYTLGTVMGRIALSPHASLHFIRVKEEVLVVGVTQQSVNLLRTMEAELFDAEDIRPADTAENNPPSGDFLSQLRISQSGMAESSTGVDEELDSLKGDLQRLKQYFQDSARERE